MPRLCIRKVLCFVKAPEGFGVLCVGFGHCVRCSKIASALAKSSFLYPVLESHGCVCPLGAVGHYARPMEIPEPNEPKLHPIVCARRSHDCNEGPLHWVMLRRAAKGRLSNSGVRGRSVPKIPISSAKRDFRVYIGQRVKIGIYRV